MGGLPSCPSMEMLPSMTPRASCSDMVLGRLPLSSSGVLCCCSCAVISASSVASLSLPLPLLSPPLPLYGLLLRFAGDALCLVQGSGLPGRLRRRRRLRLDRHEHRAPSNWDSGCSLVHCWQNLIKALEP